MSRLRDGLDRGCEDKARAAQRDTALHLRAHSIRPAQAALLNATSGFVETKACIVTRGPYAPQLLKVRRSGGLALTRHALTRPLQAWRAYLLDNDSASEDPGQARLRAALRRRKARC